MQTGTAVLVGLAAALGIGIGVACSSQYFDISNPKSILSAIAAERGVSLRSGVAYGENARHNLDIYEPSAGEGRAIVVFLYGGGWKSGERSTYGFLGAALASRGFSVVIPDYRLYPDVRFPAFVEDAASAYAWTARNVGHGRPIYLMGHSAGAHMAALMALDPRYLAEAGPNLPKPKGVIGLAGPYAFDPTTWPTTKEIFSTAVSADSARPAAHVSPSAPPMLMMHGLKDNVVKLYNLRDMDAALQSAGVSSKAVELEGMGHIGIMLAIARPFRWKGPVLKEILAFLEAGTPAD